MTLLRKISLAWLIQQLKNAWFWFSVVLGAAMALLFYQKVLGKLWTFESLRTRLASLGLLVFFSAVCFCILNYFLLPQLKKFTKFQRAGIFVACAVIPLMLLLASVHVDVVFNKIANLAKETAYFLLPAHTIRIQASADKLERGQNVVLAQFSTQAKGNLSPNVLDLTGWERRGDEWILTDPADNQITWRGKAGYSATLVFKSISSPATISIFRDGNQGSYSLFSTTPKNITITEQFPVPFYAGWLLTGLALVLSILFFTLVLLVGLLLFPGISSAPARSQWAWVMYAAPMVLTWSIYLLIFWPGFLSFDSLNQWTQMATGEYINWHPVAHTLTIWLVTHIWNTPASMAILQILVLAGVLGWGIATLREIGLPAWISWLVAILLAIFPSNGLLSITLWKDVLFTAVVVALTILILKIVATHGTWLNKRLSWLSLGTVLTFICLYRQNGYFVAFACLVILAWVFRKYWKTFARAGGLLLAIYLAFNGPVLQLLNAQPLNKARYQVVLANLLAGQMNAGTYFSPQDLAVLKPGYYKDTWPYNCYRNHSLITGANLDRDYLTAHTRDLINIAFKVTLENPVATVEHFACQGDFVIYVPQSDTANDPVYMDIYHNTFGIKQSSIIPGLVAPLTSLIDKLLQSRSVMWFMWRAPFWMYLCIFGCILFAIRNKNWQPFLILLPGLLTVLPYVFLSLGQFFRYVYCIYLIGILLSSYFWLCKFPVDKSEN